MEKTQADNIVPQALCAMCGRKVYIDPRHGRITCQGCDQYTDYCLCDEVGSSGLGRR